MTTSASFLHDGMRPDHPNARKIEQFYTAFAQLKPEDMVQLYAPDVVFSDPVFTHLEGEHAKNMWRMLCGRAQGLQIMFSDVEANDTHGRAHWDAHYLFGPSKRPVLNRIDAEFTFNKDGLVVRHVDTFDLYRWARQALGGVGVLCGCCAFVHRKIRAQAMSGLTAYEQKQSR